jgi:hypothetical protein
MAGCPSKLLSIGFELPLGGFPKTHCLFPSYIPLSILFPTHPSRYTGLGIGLANHLGVVPCGKNGLKAWGVKAADNKILRKKP